MADLPTFTNLTAPQMAVLLDAFRPFEGATNAQAATAYKDWLREQLSSEVKRRLRAKAMAASQANLDASGTVVDDALAST